MALALQNGNPKAIGARGGDNEDNNMYVLL